MPKTYRIGELASRLSETMAPVAAETGHRLVGGPFPPLELAGAYDAFANGPCPLERIGTTTMPSAATAVMPKPPTR